MGSFMLGIVIQSRKFPMTSCDLFLFLLLVATLHIANEIGLKEVVRKRKAILNQINIPIYLHKPIRCHNKQ